MRKYFEISGYWKDTEDEFDGFIVTNFDDVEEDGEFGEDEVFFFGLSETDLKEAIELGGDTMHDFVITSYKEI